MKTAVVIEGEEVARIVATFIGQQGAKIETYNRGTGVVFPAGRISVDGTLMAFDKLELLIYVDATVPIDYKKLSDAIFKLKGH